MNRAPPQRCSVQCHLPVVFNLYSSIGLCLLTSNDALSTPPCATIFAPSFQLKFIDTHCHISHERGFGCKSILLLVNMDNYNCWRRSPAREVHIACHTPTTQSNPPLLHTTGSGHSVQMESDDTTTVSQQQYAVSPEGTTEKEHHVQTESDDGNSQTTPNITAFTEPQRRRIVKRNKLSLKRTTTQYSQKCGICNDLHTRRSTSILCPCVRPPQVFRF